MIAHQHYLKCFPAVAPCVLALRVDGEAQGVVIFAMPPKQTSVRYGAETWELARLWTSDDLPANTETWLIAQAIRHVRQHHSQVKAIVSYADPSQNHQGTIYKAANFKSDGMTDDDRKTPRFDYVAGGKRYQRKGHVPPGMPVDRIARVSKHRYIYHMEGR